MRWQGAARIIVAVIGIGTAAGLYIKTRQRPAVARPSAPAAVDPSASVQSGQGTTIRYRANDKQFTMEYQSVRTYPDGRIQWSGARLVLEDGTTVVADIVDSVGKTGANDMPNEMLLKGHVEFRTAEGMSIRAEEVKYVEATGQATVPGPVSFTRGRMSGTGVGAIYERDTGTFKLLADAHMVTAAAPETPNDHVEASAATMTFNRAGNALLLDDHARIAHGSDVMTANRSTLYLTPDQQQFKVIELRGNSRVDPIPGQQSGTPEMRAQDIDLAFYDGTQALQRAVLTRQASIVLIDGAARRSIVASTIMLTTAPNGQTLTHLEGLDRVTVKTPAQNGAPERTITASSLVATGDDAAGLTAAQFAGGVRFVEAVPGPNGRGGTSRTGTSVTLNMKLKGNLDAIDEAQFQQNVSFVSGDVTGDADLGLYLASKGQLTLRPLDRTPKRMPRVTDGSVTVDATELIDVDLNTNDMHARRDVKTLTKGGQSKTPNGGGESGLFNDRDPMYGQAAEFWYDGETKEARYLGTPAARARVTQGESRVVGVEITMRNETRDLVAKGGVDSTFPLQDAKKPAAATKDTYRFTAESLDYKDAARTATYVGAPVTMTGKDGTTTASRVVLTLEAASNALKRLDATGNVRSRLSTGRDSLSDVLVYESARGQYTLRGLNGQEAMLREARQKPNTCSIMRMAVAYFTESDQVAQAPGDENPGGSSSRDYSGADCTGELKR